MAQQRSYFLKQVKVSLLIFSFLVLFKDMRARGQSKISLFCVWCKSRELGGRVSPRFSCITTASGEKLLLGPSARYNKLLERFAFRILSNIHDGVLLQK